MSETAPFDTPAPQDAHRFPCDQCGADMRFAPGQNKLICDHCGNENEITDDGAGAGPWDSAEGGIRELDFRSALRDRLDAAEMEETRVLHCDNCGAQVTLAPEVHAKAMPVLRHARGDRHRHAPAYQAAGAGALSSVRTAGP